MRRSLSRTMQRLSEAVIMVSSLCIGLGVLVGWIRAELRNDLYMLPVPTALAIVGVGLLALVFIGCAFLVTGVSRDLRRLREMYSSLGETGSDLTGFTDSSPASGQERDGR